MNEKFEIVFTAPAVYDLKRIKTYLDGLDPSIFIAFINEMERRTNSLEICPYIASVFLILHGKKYRRLRVKGYIVVYDIDDRKNMLFIDRIFHHNEDYYHKIL